MIVGSTLLLRRSRGNQEPLLDFQAVFNHFFVKETMRRDTNLVKEPLPMKILERCQDNSGMDLAQVEFDGRHGLVAVGVSDMPVPDAGLERAIVRYGTSNFVSPLEPEDAQIRDVRTKDSNDILCRLVSGILELRSSTASARVSSLGSCERSKSTSRSASFVPCVQQRHGHEAKVVPMNLCAKDPVRRSPSTQDLRQAVIILESPRICEREAYAACPG